MTAKDKARRWVRLAVRIGLLAPAYEYVRYILFTDGNTLFYGFVATFGLLALVISALLAWFFALPAIQLASKVFHALFGRTIPRAQWQEATLLALWPLPIATALGVATWIVYSIGKFGGWPTDVIFGTVANVIGAWCYGTIIWSWIKLRRETIC